MSLDYFNQERADPRDLLLREAIRKEIVPPDCLLAGAIVLGQHESGKDPCASCPCERERCGSSRPQIHRPDEDLSDPVEIRNLRTGDDASARKLNRMRHLERLDALVSGKD